MKLIREFSLDRPQLINVTAQMPPAAEADPRHYDARSNTYYAYVDVAATQFGFNPEADSAELIELPLTYRYTLVYSVTNQRFNFTESLLDISVAIVDLKHGFNAGVIFNALKWHYIDGLSLEQCSERLRAERLSACSPEELKAVFIALNKHLFKHLGPCCKFFEQRLKQNHQPLLLLKPQPHATPAEKRAFNFYRFYTSAQQLGADDGAISGMVEQSLHELLGHTIVCVARQCFKRDGDLLRVSDELKQYELNSFCDLFNYFDSIFNERDNYFHLLPL